jgi:hypothetical protein
VGNTYFLDEIFSIIFSYRGKFPLARTPKSSEHGQRAICNQQVIGSNPIAGSIDKAFNERRLPDFSYDVEVESLELLRHFSDNFSGPAISWRTDMEFRVATPQQRQQSQRSRIPRTRMASRSEP